MRRLVKLTCVTVFSLGASTAAAQDIKKECATAYVDAQKLKKDGALKSAREKLILCARDECLAAVKKDCLAWLDEVNASIPSVVVSALDVEGQETLAVEVSVDGEVMATELDPKGIELDPGTHKLRFRLGGQEPIEREIILRAGQKNKLVEISWHTPQERAPEPSGDTVATELSTEDAGSKPIPTLSYVLGGVGVVALAATGYFWLSSESAKKDLEDSGCTPNCDPSDVDSIEDKRLFGDIALGVGVVSLGVATYLWLGQSGAEKKASPSAARLDVRVTPGGAYGGVVGRF